MRFRSSPLLFLCAASAAGASDKKAPSNTAGLLPACTATSHNTGAFFDLRPDRAVPPGKGTSKHAIIKDYTAKGYDYGKNFTLNICGAVVDQVSDVVGVDEANWANVSAYYMSQGKIFSIGSETMDLQSRGRKLVLQYTGGSPCGEDASKTVKRSPQTNYKYEDHLDQTSEDAARETPSAAVPDETRRKSTIISFLCDHDPSVAQAGVSFVGTDPEECSYFFEVRSSHACAHAEPHKPGSVGPGSVFGLILVIAFLVYLLGGIFYNRSIAHARGWRQLPNYSLWASIWSFICDVFAIILAECARRFPARRGYRHLNSSPTRRGRDSDAENRLIDQLDEEWED